MKKFLFLTLFLVLLAGITNVWASDIFVPSGVSTIQGAIDSANEGDVIHIAAGSYYENISLNKRVSLIGSGSGDDDTSNTLIYKDPAGVQDSQIGVLQLTASGLSDSDPILIKDFRIKVTDKAGISVGRFTLATGVTIDYYKFVNVKVYGDNQNSPTEQERGFYVDLTSTARHLTFQYCAFNNLTYGWYFQKQVSLDASTVSNITVNNTEFDHNNHKGIYAEKLSDASFTSCLFNENGYDASPLPSYFSPWCAGVDINLKAGTYSNFMFDSCTVTNNGTGGSKEGVGLTVKGRGDGATYGAYPASVSTVQIIGCTITGNERGVRFGEPNANNVTPTGVVITGGTIANNTQHYTGTDGTSYGDIINMTAAAGVSVNGSVLPAGGVVWNVIPGYSIQAAINAADPGDVINVVAGTYNEKLLIDKAVSVIGSEGAILDGTDLPTTGFGVHVASGNVTFDNFEVRNFAGHGILVGYEYEAGVTLPGSLPDVHITNCYVHNIVAGTQGSGAGIYVGHASEGFTNGTLSTHLDYTGLIIINNEVAITNDATIILQSITAGTGVLSVSGNNLHNGSQSGIWIDAARKISIANNIIDNNANGLFFTGGAAEGWYYRLNGGYGPKDINIVGNTITDSSQRGIAFFCGWPATITVEGNYIDGNTTAGVYNYFSNTSLDASPNWWGDLDPINDVSSNVSYDPWYDSSAMDHLMSNAPVEIVDRNLFYNSIQSAIDAAIAGETITVAAGTYAENLTINKAIELRGANYNNGFSGRARVAESIIAPASGLPVSITVDGVTFNGFEVTAPSNVTAIALNYTSNVTVAFNYVHHVASTASAANVHAIIYHVGSSAYSNIKINDNKLDYIGRSSLTGYSISAIGILQSTSTGVLTGLEIKRNLISNVEVSTGVWPTGKIAYGIIINTGSANYQTTTGKVVSADISGNAISHLTGYVVTALALEGNTENAIVQGNDISYLTGYKTGSRVDGGYDLNGVKFEANRYAGTVALNNNVIRAETFINNGISNRGYAIANYVPSSIAIPSLSGNWLGSALFADLVDNDAMNGKIFNKATCLTDFVPYSTSPSPLNTDGIGPVTNITRSTNFVTIQEAINDPNTVAGDVIKVTATTFNVTSPIVVNKSITLSGTIEMDGRTLIQGTDPAVTCVLEIRASNVTVENLEITHNNVPAFPTPGGWVELNVSLVRIPAELEPDLTNVVFQNNYIHIAPQTGEMSTWTGIAMTIGSRSVNGLTITGNEVCNTRNGIVCHYGNTLTYSNNIIYNTKGGIMNYTNDLADASHRTMIGNIWSTVHNEWDIVWNTGGTLVDPDYQITVLALANANNGAYVCDLRTTGNATLLTGNRSVIFVDDDDPYSTTTVNAQNGNMNVPYANLQLGLAAVVPGGKVYVASGNYVETGQLAVNKNVNIIGADKATTIIKPAQDTAGSGDAQAFILVGEGKTMNLSNVTIDCGGKLVRNAIRSKGSGTLNNVVVQNAYYSQYIGWGLAYDYSVPNQNWTITNSTFQNIERVDILVDGQTNVATITGSTFIGKGAGDMVNYGIEIGDGANAIIGPTNSFSNFLGVASVDGSESGGVMMTSYFGPHPTATVSGNTFTNNSYGIMIGYYVNDTSHMTITNNTFNHNRVQVTAVSNTVVDLNATWANNTYDHKFLYDYTIYGSGSVLYVTAPKGLIKDNESQVYSVKATFVENLRGFTVKIKIPRADFNQPDITEPGVDFAIGSSFTDHGYMTFLQPVIYDDTDPLSYTYTVDGAYYSGGPDSGITDENVELFTVALTSLIDRDNISVPGCLISMPLANVQLRNANNGPIACVATEPMLVLIDASEPTMVHNNATTYPTGYLLSVIPDGSGLLNRPTLDFTFADNYNLNNVQYLIQAENLAAPATIGQFPLQYILQNSLLATATLGWQLPAEVDALIDGTYTVYYLVLDDAGNYNIYDWDFIIDTTAPAPIVWWPEPTAVNQPAPCRTTPDANNSIDLKWTNGAGTAKVDIWRYCFGDAITYPEYDVPGFNLPAAPNPYHASPDNGWVRVADDVAAEVYTDSGMPRGYYYYTIFAQDTSGNLSTVPAAPFHRESISYWPGDVDVNAGSVQAGDISMLSAKWGKTSTSAGWSNIIDVGPTTDNARRSRPTPDNVINIEDMMIFAMNYYNTNYSQFPRQDEESPAPITIAVNVSQVSAQLRVTLDLADNGGALKGISIPVSYGSGLQLVSVEQGTIWPESSLLLHTDADRVVEVSASVLGPEATADASGSIATLIFAIVGDETGLQLQRMTARDKLNREIEITNNPGAYTDNDDLINVIPTENYLAQNYPNPFNPTTTVRFGLKEAGKVLVSIYNGRGQLVRTLANDTKAAGTYQIVWDGRDNNGQPASSGLYLIRLETAGQVQTRKALMIK